MVLLKLIYIALIINETKRSLYFDSKKTDLNRSHLLTLLALLFLQCY